MITTIIVRLKVIKRYKKYKKLLRKLQEDYISYSIGEERYQKRYLELTHFMLELKAVLKMLLWKEKE